MNHPKASTEGRKLRVATWNVRGRQVGKGELAQAGSISEIVRKYRPDVVCLQEVHFYDGKPDEQLVAELAAAGLVHFVGKPFSDSHLDEKACLGIAIASVWPVTRSLVFTLTNPGLKASVHGESWTMHDKGMIGCKVESPDIGEVEVHSVHLFPFHEFRSVAQERDIENMWREFWTYVDSLGSSETVIVAGDYNEENREKVASEWSSKQWQFCVNKQVTTDWGISIDDVAVRPASEPMSITIAPTFSDHHFVMADLCIQGKMPDGLAKASGMVAGYFKSKLHR